ncbi:hypothetical protein C8R44DRAFT_889551 [Mycena epipterygia]|nr:hypothetical protein C8R44DRAFT_889551 [Mycena epipterygia]
MPRLAAAESFNATFAPDYIPVAVFAGGTSGVGQAMAEALARLTHGCAHIILIGRNAETANKILASLPKPNDPKGWKHEFVSCDATSMAEVRATCAGLLARLSHINFLVMSAGANSLVESSDTSEGLDHHLSLRYYSRYVWTKELLPLVSEARRLGQEARVMSILGAGFGNAINTDDIGLDKARAKTIKPLKGAMLSFAAVKGMITSPGLNDAMMAWFASQNPDLAFTHIHPGLVRTSAFHFEFGWLLAPLAWLVQYILSWFAISQDEAAQYMLYALLSGVHGLFLRSPKGDVISAHAFDAPYDFSAVDPKAPTAHKNGYLAGVRLKGYSGSDVSVRKVVEYTEGKVFPRT